MNAIETTGETVSEESVPRERPRFTIAGYVDWLRDPANDAKIRAWSKATDEAIYQGMRKVDKTISETGGLILECFQDESVAESLFDDLLSRFVK